MSDGTSGSTPPAPTLCCAPYDNRLLGTARPELGAALGIYGTPYAAAAAAQSYPGYLPYGPEPPALYGALVSAGDGVWDWVSEPVALEGSSSSSGRSTVTSLGKI